MVHSTGTRLELEHRRDNLRLTITGNERLYSDGAERRPNELRKVGVRKNSLFDEEGVRIGPGVLGLQLGGVRHVFYDPVGVKALAREGFELAIPALRDTLEDQYPVALNSFHWLNDETLRTDRIESGLELRSGG
jgi:hypothetical protein